MNKKQLYESIMSSVSKEVKKALNEYRRAAVIEEHDITEKDIDKWLKKSQIAWLQEKIKNNVKLNHTWDSGWSTDTKLHIRSYIYSANNYCISIENLYRSNSYSAESFYQDLESIYKYLRSAKEFTIKSAKLRTSHEIEFNYNINLDNELYNAIEAAKNQFEQDVQAESADEFAPTRRDWEKMIGYMNNHSNPERVAKSCKDHNKIVARYIIAKTLGWAEAAREFLYKIKNENILSEVQLEAYRRKYATYNIPEDLQEFIDDMKEFDATGGLATHDENLSLIPDNAKKYIHSNSNISNYRIELLDDIVNVKDHTKANRRNNYHSYTYDTGNKCKLAKLIFDMADGTTQEYYYVYYTYGQYSKGVSIYRYKPSYIMYDEYKHVKNTTILNNLKFILEGD